MISASEIRVPDDQRTIQAAIDAAETGDTVLVGPGTYHERLQLKPNIRVRSAGSDENGGNGIVIRENGSAVLSGNQINGYRKTVSDPEKVTVVEE